MIKKHQNYKILAIGLIFAMSFVLFPLSKAVGETDVLEQLELTLITITSEKNTAEIIWDTNYPTWGKIHFGITKEFGSWIESPGYAEHHETALSGLAEDTKYYFKLEAYDSAGRQLTSSVWNFTTEEENDITPPILTNVRTPFVGGTHVQFVWETNESATSCVYYGTSMDNLDKHECNNSKVLVHDIMIDKFAKYTFYYFRVYSKDAKNNGAYSVYYNFRTDLYDDTNLPALAIYKTGYAAEIDQDGQARATVTFQANRPVKGQLRWGIKSGSYNKKIYLSAPRSNNNQVTITGLKPDMAYYYMLELTDVLNKKLNSEEYIIITPPLAAAPEAVVADADYNQSDPEQDFDADGLTNGQEALYGTSPIKSDSDGDGYPDGMEVINCYNPLGADKMAVCPNPNAGLNYFAYDKFRVKDLRIEINAANEIKYELEALFKGRPFKVSRAGWYVLVNAYIYGGYPIEAITQAVKYGGKTVHPEIPWNVWKNSADYLEYIDK